MAFDIAPRKEHGDLNTPDNDSMMFGSNVFSQGGHGSLGIRKSEVERKSLQDAVDHNQIKIGVDEPSPQSELYDSIAASDA